MPRAKYRALRPAPDHKRVDSSDSTRVGAIELISPLDKANEIPKIAAITTRITTVLMAEPGF
jgi:hypothetical protein